MRHSTCEALLLGVIVKRLKIARHSSPRQGKEGCRPSTANKKENQVLNEDFSRVELKAIMPFSQGGQKMNHKQRAVILVLSAIFLGGSVTSALARDIHGKLSGYQEVPAVSTTGKGIFFLKNTRPYTVELSYELEGEIIQAHIHLGQAGVNGGIMIWLCANRDPRFELNPPPGTPDCTGHSGFVSRDLRAEYVVGPSAQGIEEVDGVRGRGLEAIHAIRAGAAYVNVHSTFMENGEIRGQLRFSESDESLENLRSDLDELRSDFERHTHQYLTGKGEGHNNTEATSGPPEF